MGPLLGPPNPPVEGGEGLNCSRPTGGNQDLIGHRLNYKRKTVRRTSINDQRERGESENKKKLFAISRLTTPET